ncbi:MAG: right-handed parallel beta-helix repeat-containing protein [Candidatus Brockarchaeota archaeon]|nr:right-handed parallel beta-helix repeat-containing protein [Candidatus Brockarchaeota archaeon]
MALGLLSWYIPKEHDLEPSRRKLELERALAEAKPGSVILLEPGVYEGGIYVENLRGEPGKPIVIGAEDPLNPPVINGGRECLHLVEPAYVEVRDIIFSGASENGLNVDDGGSYETPAIVITLRNLKVVDIGPEGNRDGIKMSGVDSFAIENCTVERWGSGGSGIDLVGCHNGIIVGCVFRHGDDVGASGIQVKGGSCNVTIRGCRFEHAGLRAVNIGGSTDMGYFRPQPPPGYEAKGVLVEGCVFLGSEAPIAFVGAEGSAARFNTIYRPRRWILRILQETVGPGFAPCRDCDFTDNVIYFMSREIAEAVNVGSNTSPETFRFARNFWYAADDPGSSAPILPVEEEDGVYGLDPDFADPEGGDFRLKPGSPATGKGAFAQADEAEGE